MSGVAAISAAETAIRLVPKYLYGKATINQPWAPEWDQPAQYTTETTLPDDRSASSRRALSPTEDLRRRIAEAALPEQRRQPRAFWLGLAAVVVLASAGLMYPEAFAALLPDVDTSL